MNLTMYRESWKDMANTESFESFTKKWRKYVEESTMPIPVEDWDVFFAKTTPNPIAGIDRGEMQDVAKLPYKGETQVNERKSFIDSWPSIIRPLFQDLYKLTEEDAIKKKLKEIHSTIQDVLDNGNGRKRPLAINRILTTFLPDRLLAIPKEEDVTKLIAALNCSGISIIDNGNWIDNSFNTKRIFDLYYPNQSHWAIYQNLKELMNKKQRIMKEMKNLLESNYNLILTGAPGTGKTYLARQIANAMGASEANGQFEFVQFHPSYDYTDFVEGLRPEQDGNNVVFKRHDGIFKAFCKKAAEDTVPEHKYVFVIDEINRGEISKIFGELFFSIDPGYRGETDIDTGNDNRVKTQYQNLIDKDNNLTEKNYPFKKGFYVPINVYVIGTMNDIDRSVESMDFAFRRRFAFYEVTAKETQDSILAGSQYKTDAIRKMDALNNAIEKQEGFGSAYNIGAAYFKKIDKYSGHFEQLWDNHIKGVLFEYLRGLPNATEILETWKNEFDK